MEVHDDHMSYIDSQRSGTDHRFPSCEAVSSLNMVKRKKEEFKISMNE